MDGTEHRFSPSGRLPGGDFRVRRQSCQQDGAEQQRERAAPPGHVCASAYGGVSGAQSRFAGADCPAGQPCRPADRRAHCPADCRAPCRADFRVESVHVSPPLPLRQCMRRGAFSCGRGDCPAGACLLHPRAEPGRHRLFLWKAGSGGGLRLLRGGVGVALRCPEGGAGGVVARRPCLAGTRRGRRGGSRLPTLPLALFLPPSPRPPSRREGGE